MSISDFLLQPYDSCRTTLILGEPNSGKSFTALKGIDYWLKNDTFKRMELVLPTFQYEQNDSYKFLTEYKGKTKIRCHQIYHHSLGKDLVEGQKKKLLGKTKKEQDEEKILFLIDDTTHQKGNIFRDKHLTEVATTSRHLRVHTIIIMHYEKGIIPRDVKKNIGFLFVLQLDEESWYDIFRNSFDFPKEFRKGRKGFEMFFNMIQKMYDDHDHGCLLIDKINRKYNTNVAFWFN